MLETFRPLLDAVRALDVSDPLAAERALARAFDPAGPEAERLAAELRRLLEEGRIAQRGEPPVRWGRVARAEPATHDLSIDVVHMSGPGPRHRHPRGEIDYCIPLAGRPTFDGRAPGWVVYGEGSVHTPTVAGGEMLVVYFLPKGEIEFQA